MLRNVFILNKILSLTNPKFSFSGVWLQKLELVDFGLGTLWRGAAGGQIRPRGRQPPARLCDARRPVGRRPPLWWAVAVRGGRRPLEPPWQCLQPAAACPGQTLAHPRPPRLPLFVWWPNERRTFFKSALETQNRQNTPTGLNSQNFIFLKTVSKTVEKVQFRFSRFFYSSK